MTSLWFPESEYQQALHHAITVARSFNGTYDVGLEKLSEYGKPGFHSGFLLPKPEYRFGFELQCEVIKASDPLPY